MPSRTILFLYFTSELAAASLRDPQYCVEYGHAHSEVGVGLQRGNMPAGYSSPVWSRRYSERWGEQAARLASDVDERARVSAAKFPLAVTMTSTARRAPSAAQRHFLCVKGDRHQTGVQLSRRSGPSELE
ncbi:hypothetical protein M427DRAFT_34528 [Gonapodya prolifera JEL478]|uniref:Uncharacterized protein n=1 Tax=Gonapodya prolifera (strain JEL478) TaxID=1344416 RepID=A0A139A7D5_GONPJ|nr:hypothetical protein M427DRAFT_34528 [Gonapodya prolifera JEL478]|eukprot:KXS12690.1 hypothetical protein M427DRAFT_34528 [Gonapodya prolifera JEL478]